MSDPEVPVRDPKQVEAEKQSKLNELTNKASNDILKRNSDYVKEKEKAMNSLTTWNDKILVFFSFQRAPYVQKLHNAQTRVANGERALKEAAEYINFVSKTHASASKSFSGVSFFGKDLSKCTNNVPEFTGPHAQADPSVLALSHLASFAYASHEKHDLLVQDLKKFSVTIATLTKNYGHTAQKSISKMLAVVKRCEDSAVDIDKTFKSHQDVYDYYDQASKSNSLSKFTNSSRKDMFVTEQTYRERVLELTQMHTDFFVDCTRLLEDLHKSEQERALKLQFCLQEVATLMCNYYKGMSTIADTCFENVQGSVQVAVNNHQQQRDQQQKEQLDIANNSVPRRGSIAAANMSVKDDKFPKAEAPGPFPTNINVMIAGSVQILSGFIKRLKPFYLVLTRDNYLRCYDFNEIDSSDKNSEIFGPGSSTFKTTDDPSQVRFQLKNKGAEKGTEWVADAYYARATPKSDCEFNLIYDPPGVFSSSWELVVTCPTHSERDLWIEKINQHTGAHNQAKNKLDLEE